MHEPIWIGAPGVDPAQPPAAAALARAHADRDPLARQARETDAGRQLMRCFPHWRKALDHLRWAALLRLARGEAVDPNDPDTWAGRDQHAYAVLRRHGVSSVAPTRLTLQAVARLIDAQSAADRAAGLDWTRATAPARALDPALRRAHAQLDVDLDDPAVWTRRADQRAALARRLGLSDDHPAGRPAPSWGRGPGEAIVRAPLRAYDRKPEIRLRERAPDPRSPASVGRSSFARPCPGRC